ncbi:MAG TPA: zf-HC2 domain-containing protein [Pyrinomonadaceae bacterium]|nr:zf-HC2 domain-containing protein [Pyrinomonadaceae bacterium]
MNCNATQNSFSAYLDGRLTRAQCDAADAHLDACPFCRQRLEESRALLRGLSSLTRPAPPADLAASVNYALTIERAANTARPRLPLYAAAARWIEPRLMPYTVGLLASVLLFVTLANALRGQVGLLYELAHETPDEHSITWIRNGDFDLPSPGLDPRGDLFRVMTAPADSDDDDDDITIVANVFSNGSASVAEVMQPPRNPQMLSRVQDALRRTPAFVPASIDRRPQTMRVVLSLSKVSVHERSF